VVLVSSPTSLPENLAGLPDAIAELSVELPLDKRDQVTARYEAALEVYTRDGDASALERFAKSLVATARLYRNRYFLKALAEDEQSGVDGSPHQVDIGALFSPGAAFS
jgi:hypothetical protein